MRKKVNVKVNISLRQSKQGRRIHDVCTVTVHAKGTEGAGVAPQGIRPGQEGEGSQ